MGLVLLCACGVAQSENLLVSWNSVDDPRVVGYEVHYGTESGQYDSVVMSPSTSVRVYGLEPENTYYFAVKAFGTDPSIQSGLSEEASAAIGHAPPVAGFRSNVTQGFAPLTVQFNDWSIGRISAWEWSFGDGTSSDSATPQHQFQTPGDYPVVLKVTSPGGSSEYQSTIRVLDPTPVAAFRISAAQGVAPFAVVFTDESSGLVTSWQWTFSDGGTRTGRTANYTFQTPGDHTATLTATGPTGTSKLSKTIKVLHPPPVANFTASVSTGVAPLRVVFTDTSTGTVSQWAWNFGDGATSIARSPERTFAAPGDYRVLLRVTGPGGSAEKAMTIRVLPAPPVASFTASTTEGPAPLTVRFTNNSTGQVTSQQWAFGVAGATSQQVSPQYTFQTPGEYAVVLTATGPGGTDDHTVTIKVKEPAPVASFTASVLEGPAPLTVQFTDTSSGAITGWSWALGNGATSMAQSPEYTYQTAGDYAVVLTVTGPGGSASRTMTVKVKAPAPVAAFTASVLEGPAPLEVKFTDTSTGSVTGWSWAFGNNATSAAQSPAYTYQTAGDYIVVLTATGPGGSDDHSVTIKVTEAPLVAGFTTSVLEGPAPLNVRFTDTSTGRVTDWSWAFGNGATSTAQSPAYTFASAGEYPVVLIVTGPAGTATSRQTIRVVDAPPVASFSQNVTSGTAPLTVLFTDTSTGSVASWNWSFGDGGTATTKNAAWTYTTAGTYTVTLTAQGPGGSNTVTKSALIKVNLAPVPLAADFRANVVTGVAPLDVSFTNLTTGAATSYAWTFGDGGTSTLQTPTHRYTVPGTYRVSLTATGAAGSHTATKDAYIRVDAPTGQPSLVIESGEVTVGTAWQTVALTKTFRDPIVVANPPSSADAAPVLVRIDGVTPTSFRIRLQEWDYQDGVHAAEQVSYLVAERGRHVLATGAALEAGQMSATGGSVWDLKGFASAFTKVPVVLASVASNRDTRAVTMRLRQVAKTGFSLRLQQHETAPNGHRAETVNFIAWEPSTGTVGGVSYKVGRTAAAVNQAPYVLPFGVTYGQAPMFLATIQGYVGAEPAALRWIAKTASQVTIRVEEEQSKDTETTHPNESIGWAVFR
jgi:PKD repeat protein